MLHKIATALSRRLLKGKAFPEEDLEIYVYGFELILSFLFSTSVILLIGAITKTLPLTLVFLLVFIFTRRFTGGYHANTYAKCQIYTVSTYLFVLIGSHLIEPGIISYIILGIVGYVTVILFAPVKNPNKHLSKRDVKIFKLLSIVFFTLILVIGILLGQRYPMISSAIFLSLVAVIVLIIIPSVTERRNAV